MEMSKEFATAAVVTIPVLALASIVEIGRHRKELDAGMRRAREVIEPPAGGPIDEQIVMRDLERQELEALNKGLDSSKTSLNIWFFTALGAVVAEIGSFGWLGGHHGANDWLAWWCVVDIALFMILLVAHPTLTFTSGPTAGKEGEKSALDILKEQIQQKLEEDNRKSETL